MKKKIILLVMVMLAMFALCACVNNNDDDDEVIGTPGLFFSEIMYQHDVMGYSVSKGTADTSGAVIIPKQFENRPIIEIAEMRSQGVS